MSHGDPRGADSAVQLDEDAEHLAQRALGQWVRIPNAGHIVQRDNPPATIEAIDGLLKDARLDHGENRT